MNKSLSDGSHLFNINIFSTIRIVVSCAWRCVCDRMHIKKALAVSYIYLSLFFFCISDLRTSSLIINRM